MIFDPNLASQRPLTSKNPLAKRWGAALKSTVPLGTLERLEGSSLTVRLDGADRRAVSFDLKDYAHIDHGYAATIHKAQGVTVNRAHMLASSTWTGMRAMWG